MLKQSHIKVDNRYFAIDPNLDFEASTILCEDRVYVSDQTPSPAQPITFTIQPQFNVFRSLSESRFIFTLSVNSPALSTIAVIPKPYWAQLFIRDITINCNNVACNDQHSRTASYAGFIKILLTQGNLKTASVDTQYVVATPPATNYFVINSFGGEDVRSLQEGIVNVDSFNGADWFSSYNNVVMSRVVGANNCIGLVAPYASVARSGIAIPPTPNSQIELTYRPQDGIFLQPKLLPPGVNLNYIFSTTSIGTWANGYQTTLATSIDPGASANLDVAGFTYNIVSAKYLERQYTCTQSALKAYQGLIMRQPLYFTCMTGNTLLYPVAASAQSIQLTNVFSGRLPNLCIIALLSQGPTSGYNSITPTGGNTNLLKTYSPTPTVIDSWDGNGAALPADCIQSIQLTVNGRTYPHLYSINMQSGSTQDVSQVYEQYLQCALISKLNGRSDGASNTNFDVKYKYDNPILTKSEFQSQATFWCYNIRRSTTLMNDSGDKEVGGIDMLVNINGTAHPNAQLLVAGINTDSLATFTDGGSTTSFVF
jgi:hypothetical protein